MRPNQQALGDSGVSRESSGLMHVGGKPWQQELRQEVAVHV